MAARGSKYRRRRGRFGVLYKLLSVLLILVAVGAGCIVFFRVEHINVTGSTTYTQQQIVDASGVEMGDNLFLIRRVPTGRSILGDLPYLKEVNIRRAPPNSLEITVAECLPVAALQGEDDSWWIVDSSVKLLEQGDAALADPYMKITGLTLLMPSAGERAAVSVEESTKLESLRSILSALEERGMYSQVNSVDLSAQAEIRMVYRTRFEVRMPLYSDDFYLLIHTLEAVADNGAVAGRPGTIDLTGERPRFIPKG